MVKLGKKFLSVVILFLLCVVLSYIKETNGSSVAMFVATGISSIILIIVLVSKDNKKKGEIFNEMDNT